MNKRHYEHTLPNIRGSLSNTYGPVHAGLGLDGKYAYGVSLFERAFLGGTRLGDGKGDTAVFRAWLLLFLPAGGYGQQDKEAADYRCY